MVMIDKSRLEKSFSSLFFFVHILRIEIFDGGPPVSILDFSARQKL